MYGKLHILWGVLLLDLSSVRGFDTVHWGILNIDCTRSDQVDVCPFEFTKMYK